MAVRMWLMIDCCRADDDAEDDDAGGDEDGDQCVARATAFLSPQLRLKEAVVQASYRISEPFPDAREGKHVLDTVM